MLLGYVAGCVVFRYFFISLFYACFLLVPLSHLSLRACHYFPGFIFISIFFCLPLTVDVLVRLTFILQHYDFDLKHCNYSLWACGMLDFCFYWLASFIFRLATVAVFVYFFYFLCFLLIFFCVRRWLLEQQLISKYLFF